jgi:hypothetical protein
MASVKWVCVLTGPAVTATTAPGPVTLLNFDVRFTPESGHSSSAIVMSALGQ